MSESTAPAPAPAAAPAAAPTAAPVPGRRAWWWRLAALLLLLAGLGLVLAWQAQDRVLRYAIDQAVQASGGRLLVDGARGTLLEGGRIDRLQWREPAGLQADLHDLRLSWRWRSLLQGRLVLRSVSARSLKLAPGTDGSPVSLPVSIALPLPVTIEALRLDNLRIELPGAAPQNFTRVELRGDYAPGRYRIDHLSLRTAWGDARLEGELADTAPFAADAWVQGKLRWQQAQLALKAVGPLADLAVGAALAVPTRTPVPMLQASGRLTMLAPRLLGPVALKASGFTPDLLGLTTMRQGLFEGEGMLNWDNRAPADGIRAQLDLRNRQPAPLDAAGLPLSRARGLLNWRAGQWRIDSLQAMTTGARDWNLSGTLTIDGERTVRLPWLSIPWLQADLQLAGLDAGSLDTRLPAGELSGRLKVDETRFDIDLSDARRGGFSVKAGGRLDGDSLRLDQGQATSWPGLGRAQIQAQGMVQVVAPWALELSGRFAELDLAALQAKRPTLIEMPLKGVVDGLWTLKGELRDGGAARSLDATIDVERGQLQGQSVRARAGARLEGDHLSRITMALELGANRLQANGAFGLPGDRLEYRLEAPAMASLAAALGWPAVEGELIASGVWSGTPEKPALTLEASASRLQWGADRMGQASLSAQLDERRLSLRGQAQALVIGGQRFERLSASGDGTPAAHQMRIEASRGNQQWSGELEGALALPLSPNGNERGLWWEGRLRELQTRGPLNARLREPAALALGPDLLRLGALVIDGDFGVINLSRGQWQAGRFALLGQAELVRLASMARLLGWEAPALPPDVDPDAVRLSLKADLSGTQRDDLSGSLVVKMIPPAGFKGALDTDLSLREGRLSGRLVLDLPSLSVANRWIGPQWSIDGRLSMSGSVSGTLAAPRLAGEVRGEALQLEQRSLGWRLGAGRLVARFEGDRLQVQSLRLYSGQAAIDVALKSASPPENGSIELSGEVTLADRSGRFGLVASSALVPLGPGQRLIVSGSAQALSRAGRFELNGQLRADEGLIELRGGDAPTLPSDVEIVNRQPASGQPQAGSGPSGLAANGRPVPGEIPGGSRPADSSLSIVSDLTLDLGEKLRVRGSGVDARITGTVNLKGSLPDAPRAFGTVRVRDGTYSAYGQQLQIQRGRVVFNGPIDNPLLDLVALRRNLPVEAGVALSGTVLAPRIRLTSQPEVSDAEKLSWLVLGVPLDSAQTGAQTAALQAAAATLFGGNDGGLARALGLDVLTVRSSAGADTLGSSTGLSGFNQSGAVPGQVSGATVGAGASATTQSVVAIGKRLSSKLVVTYEQGLRGVWNLLRIQYDITTRLSLRAQTGSESAIDVLYRYSFD